MYYVAEPNASSFKLDILLALMNEDIYDISRNYNNFTVVILAHNASGLGFE